jgi:ATP-binding protein involved in chromosome partitioning
MLGVDEPPPVRDQKIQPLEAHGVKVMSIGFMIERDQPAIWRGPIVMKVITQFLRDVAWGELDYLVVDMPPGTGDAQLSLVQATHVAGAVIVTTPQEMAVGDALRGAKMFERVNVPVIGIVENMSAYTDPATGATLELFSSGGGRRLADELGVPLLGQVPLDPLLREQGDIGEPIVAAHPDSETAQIIAAVAEAIDTTREPGSIIKSLPLVG